MYYCAEVTMQAETKEVLNLITTLNCWESLTGPSGRRRKAILDKYCSIFHVSREEAKIEIVDSFICWFDDRILDGKSKTVSEIIAAMANGGPVYNKIFYCFWQVYLKNFLLKETRRRRMLAERGEELMDIRDPFQSLTKARLIEAISDLSEEELKVLTWSVGMVTTEQTGMSERTLYRKLDEFKQNRHPPIPADI